MTHQVGVYLLPSAVRAVEEARRAARCTNAEVAFDAIDATQDRLAELVAARRSGPSRPAESLFRTRRVTSTRTKARDGRRSLWSFQATQEELDVIEGLRQATQADSVSELVSVAVEAYVAELPETANAGTA